VAIALALWAFDMEFAACRHNTEVRTDLAAQLHPLLEHRGDRAFWRMEEELLQACAVPMIGEGSLQGRLPT